MRPPPAADRETRGARERVAVDRTGDELPSVVAGESRAGGRVGTPDDAAGRRLLDACRLVGAAQEVTIRASQRRPGDAARVESVVDLCAASRIRYRRVLLHGDWWRRDNGPLLGFLSAGAPGDLSRPVALLPRGSGEGAYDLVDPSTGRPVRVDAARAGALLAEAYMFYTPLPRRALGLRDVLRAAVRNSRRDLVTLVLVGLAGGLLALMVPLMTARVVHDVVPDRDVSQLAALTLALVAGAVAGALFQAVRGFAVLRVETRADRSLQAAIWDHLLSLPASFFRRFSTGDLQSRAMGIDAIREVLSGYVLTSVLGVVFSLASFAILFRYNVRLALVATLLVILFGAITTGISYAQVRHQRSHHRTQGKVASLVFDLLGGIVQLRVGGGEARAFAVWRRLFAQQREHAVQVQRLAAVQTTVGVVYGVFTPLVLFAMVGLSSTMHLPLGDFLAFNAAFGQFQAASLGAVALLARILSLIPLYERMNPILRTEPEVGAESRDVGEITGGVALRGVSFRYRDDGPMVLSDVSLETRPGELVAIVGPSGSGKSTCLRLILGFERPERGTVLVDGEDLLQLDVHSVRRQIGVVLQDGQSMAGTIFSNISGGRSISMEDAWRAARMAGIEEEVRAMPMGMHTFVNHGGAAFSGGQRQRVLIARAIIHNPRLILLDEATSALDNRTQDVVIRSLEQLQTTRIVIAHRLSSVVKADRIYVLDRGHVAESGSYDELASRGGLFSRMVARQRV